MEIEEYRDCVLDIYQTVSDPTHWTRVLDRLCETLKARGAIIFEWEGHGAARSLTAPHFTSGYALDVLSGYLRRNRAHEERDQDTFEREALLVDGIDIVTETILYEDEEDYLSRPHVRELREYGIRYRTGTMLDKDNPYRGRFSMQLGSKGGPLDGERLETLRSLLPHVAKAMDVGRPIATGPDLPIAGHAVLGVFETLDVGVALLDRRGNVILTNDEFRRQVEEHGAFHVSREGRLKLHGQADHQAYARLREDALNHGAFGARPRKEAIVVSGEERAASICIELVPIAHFDALGTAPLDGVLVITRDTGRPVNIDLDLFARVYPEMTQAELAIVEMITNGLTNGEIAERRERSIETVNAQVKSVLGKSQARNRTQLVRMLCNFQSRHAPVEP